MTPGAISPDQQSSRTNAAESEPQSLTGEQLTALHDAEKQDEYRREYLVQLKRQTCPGCGESNDVF